MYPLSGEKPSSWGVQPLPGFGGLGLGSRRDRFSPSLSDRKRVASWPLTLFPTASSGGANVPRPPFPGATVTIPPPTPLFPGSPMSYSQSPALS